MKLSINKQTGAAALVEITAALGMITIIAAQVIPNSHEIREAGLNALVVSQVMATRGALEADFAEASLSNPNAKYSDNAEELKQFLPGAALMSNTFNGSDIPVKGDEKIVDGAGNGTMDVDTTVPIAGEVRWATDNEGDGVQDGYQIKGYSADGTALNTVTGGSGL